MARATTGKRRRRVLTPETVAETQKRVEVLAAETRKALARTIAPVGERVDALAEDARAVVERAIDSLEGRLTALRRATAGCLHEAASIVSLAEKRVAPAMPAKRIRRKRANAARVHVPQHVAH